MFPFWRFFSILISSLFGFSVLNNNLHLNLEQASKVFAQKNNLDDSSNKTFNFFDKQKVKVITTESEVPNKYKDLPKDEIITKFNFSIYEKDIYLGDYPNLEYIRVQNKDSSYSKRIVFHFNNSLLKEVIFIENQNVTFFFEVFGTTPLLEVLQLRVYNYFTWFNENNIIDYKFLKDIGIGTNISPTDHYFSHISFSSSSLTFLYLRNICVSKISINNELNLISIYLWDICSIEELDLSQNFNLSFMVLKKDGGRMFNDDLRKIYFGFESRNGWHRAINSELEGTNAEGIPINHIVFDELDELEVLNYGTDEIVRPVLGEHTKYDQTKYETFPTAGFKLSNQWLRDYSKKNNADLKATFGGWETLKLEKPLKNFSLFYHPAEANQVWAMDWEQEKLANKSGTTKFKLLKSWDLNFGGKTPSIGNIQKWRLRDFEGATGDLILKVNSYYPWMVVNDDIRAKLRTIYQKLNKSPTENDHVMLEKVELSWAAQPNDYNQYLWTITELKTGPPGDIYDVVETKKTTNFKVLKVIRITKIHSNGQVDINFGDEGNNNQTKDALPKGNTLTVEVSTKEQMEQIYYEPFDQVRTIQKQLRNVTLHWKEIKITEKSTKKEIVNSNLLHNFQFEATVFQASAEEVYRIHAAYEPETKDNSDCWEPHAERLRVFFYSNDVFVGMGKNFPIHSTNDPHVIFIYGSDMQSWMDAWKINKEQPGIFVIKNQNFENVSFTYELNQKSIDKENKLQQLGHAFYGTKVVRQPLPPGRGGPRNPGEPGNDNKGLTAFQKVLIVLSVIAFAGVGFYFLKPRKKTKKL